jgi:DNA-directed RNA polymerase specialized sigma24 family protein
MKTNAAKKLNENPPKKIDWRKADDRTLVDGAIAGINGAWIELMRRFNPALQATVFAVLKKYGRVLGNDVRGDIVQDFYLSLLENDKRKLRVWDPAKGRKLGSWLGLLICQTAINEVRRVVTRPVHIDLDEVLEREDFAPEENEGHDGDETMMTPARRYDLGDARSCWQSPRTTKRKAA